MTKGHGAPIEVAGRWEALFDDVEATAADLRDEGFDVVSIHAGDVTPLTDDLTLDVLAPGDEYRELVEMLDEAEAELTEFLVFGATEGGVTFAVVVGQDPTAEVAACFPLYITKETKATLGSQAVEAGEIHFKLRPLDDESAVELTLSEPELLFDIGE